MIYKIVAGFWACETWHTEEKDMALLAWLPVDIQGIILPYMYVGESIMGGYVNVLCYEMNNIKYESIKQTLLALGKWVVKWQANMRDDLALGDRDRPTDRATDMQIDSRTGSRMNWRTDLAYATDNAGICITLAIAGRQRRPNSMWDSLNRFVMLPHELHDCTADRIYIHICIMHMCMWFKFPLVMLCL